MGGGHDILLGDIILGDTPKSLPLVPSHRIEVLTCSSLLHIVRHTYNQDDLLNTEWVVDSSSQPQPPHGPSQSVIFDPVRSPHPWL